jgi:hypothetical protein|tara:strand:+ start:988 stop:1167 length:180 start_codon:yes stop_codon:yes gene_type:complete
MTDAQLFKHLETINYSPGDHMDLEHDRKEQIKEHDIMETLKARGYTMDVIQAMRNGLDT